MKKRHPGSDFSTCRVVDTGRLPIPRAVRVVGYILNAASMVLGACWYLFRFLWRDR